MMNYYMITILNELINDERISSLHGICKDNNRKVYIEGGEYQEYSMDLIFLVDTGDLFKKTIAFTITTNSFSSEIEVIKHYSLESKIFSRRPVKNVTEYIINKILKYKNEDSQNNQHLKESIA
ncbi:hypothetical protein LGK95_15715 [Clostridium algoriphilum]|uniref:hypothetical protein n=1 Tax=Clostridium algoriphilum TaxID=198347 RepID=UPI001CF453F0|nr:hypothetical protein [Clostridium algoriphilum]MCB2294935.1 hypothetical protein [Clostridium algoriphilum]